jgi:hypothetical protein
MNKVICVLSLVLIVAWAAALGAEEGRWTVDLEGGVVVPGYNDVQVPNETGTRFSLKDDLKIDNKIYYRLRLGVRIGQRHGLSLLYAPLTLNAGGVLAQPVTFEGVGFGAGSAVDALYRFNSYRLTYRYRLVGTPNLNLWLGLTAKIRDAEISLSSGALKSTKTNVGFVPLLHLYLKWKWTKRWGFIFEADALAAKQGRAEDVSAAIFYHLGPNWALKTGYRLVEGGADVDEVYNFALINYWYAGILIHLP